MNHDYAHCLDYTTDCPEECFRAQLQKDLEERRSEFIGVPLTCSHLGGTVECKLAKDARMSGMVDKLTDKEQRIFLAAMAREEKVCEEVDRKYVHEPYEDSLMSVCKAIRRKVKDTLWT